MPKKRAHTEVALASDGFPRRLKEAREARGLSQAALGQLVGYKSRQAVGNLEAGTCEGAVRTVEQLARALGRDPRWLAYG